MDDSEYIKACDGNRYSKIHANFLTGTELLKHKFQCVTGHKAKEPGNHLVVSDSNVLYVLNTDDDDPEKWYAYSTIFTDRIYFIDYCGKVTSSMNLIHDLSDIDKKKIKRKVLETISKNGHACIQIEFNYESSANLAHLAGKTYRIVIHLPENVRS